MVVATFVVGIPLTFALHEFGHVLAARILRLRVYRVELGIGEPFATFRIGSTFVSMAWKPGGRVWSAANKLDGFSTKKAVVAGAGPLFSSALGISLIAASAVLDDFELHYRVSIAMFGAFNLFELMNFMPLQSRPTDGGNMLKALKMTPAESRESAFQSMFGELLYLGTQKSDELKHRAKALADLEPNRWETEFSSGLALGASSNASGALPHLRSAQTLVAGADMAAHKRKGLDEMISKAITECTAEAQQQDSGH